MRLLTGTLHNFGSFADAEIDLSQVSVGVVMGSNGAGKSTAVVDSVTWCFFGECRVATDAMVRLGADEMSVEWEFGLNDRRYRVLRKRSLKTERGNSELSVSLDDGAAWTPVAVGMKPAQKKLFELLNSDYQLLTATGFLLQGQADRFSRSTSGERKAILAQILRLDQYGPLKQAANRHCTSAAAKHEEKSAQLTALDAEAETADSLEARHAEVTSALAESEKALAQLEQQQQELTTKKAALTAELEQLAAIPEQLTALQIRQERLDESHRAMIIRRERAAKILAQRDTIEAKVKEEASVRQAQAMLEEDRTWLAAEVVAEQTRVSSIQSDLAAIPAQRVRLEGQQAAVRAQMTGLQARRERAAKILGNRAEIEAKYTEEAQLEQEFERMVVEEDELGQAIDQLVHDQAVVLEHVNDGFTFQRELAEGVAEVARLVGEYRQESDRLEEEIGRDDKTVGLLTQVPCGTDLQAKCQFTLQAVTVQGALSAKRKAFGERWAATLDNAESIAPAAVAAVRVLEARLSAWDERHHQQEADRLATHLTTLREDRTTRRARKETIQKERKALTTFTALVPELASAEREVTQVDQDLAQRGQELAQIEQDLQALHVRTAERERVKGEADAAWDILTARQRDVETRLQSHQRALDDLAAFTALVPELASAEREVLTVDEDLVRLDDDLGRIQAERERLESRMTARANLTIDHESLTASWNHNQTYLMRLRIDSQTAIGRLKELELELKGAQEAKRKAVELRQDCAALCLEGRQFQTLATAYAQIPVLILESSIPLLEEEANLILSKISQSGMRVRFDTQRTLKSRDGLAETLDIVVRDVFGERPYESFSGGERARLDLAMRVGLSRLLANRAGAKIETLVVDEAFAAVDQEGVESLVECLPMLSEEFPLLLFVTHDENFKSSVVQQIIVHKSATGSTVEVMA